MTTKWHSIGEADLRKGQSVLTRVDLNVPLMHGEISDDTRLRAILPTLKMILSSGAKPILLSHFGRPEIGANNEEYSTKIICTPLSRLIGAEVRHVGNSIGDQAKAAISDLPDGAVLVLENTRFHEGETANDPKFAKDLSALGDIFISDAFSAAHRAHASVVGIPRHLPSFAGLSMERELRILESLLNTPKRPIMAVVGGAKVSSKLGLLNFLISKMDHILVGGGMANTFLAAQGHEVGHSLVERDMIDLANEILAKASTAGCNIILPLDVVVAEKFEREVPNEVFDITSCPENGMILDAGPRTIAHLRDILDGVSSLIWNGPLGAFELEPFDKATTALAKIVGQKSKDGLLNSVAGGGDTVAALNKAGVAEEFGYVSTAGGAFLAWMEGKKLPGILALEVEEAK